MRHTYTVTDMEMQNCIDNCRNAHQVAVETMYHCLSKGGSHSDPNHIGMLLDFAQMTETNADFMSRNSKFHKGMCEMCAKISEDTANESMSMAQDDEKMMMLVDEAKNCMDSCRKMAKMVM